MAILVPQSPVSFCGPQDTTAVFFFVCVFVSWQQKKVCGPAETTRRSFLWTTVVKSLRKGITIKVEEPLWLRLEAIVFHDCANGRFQDALDPKQRLTQLGASRPRHWNMYATPTSRTRSFSVRCWKRKDPTDPFGNMQQPFSRIVNASARWFGDYNVCLSASWQT